MSKAKQPAVAPSDAPAATPAYSPEVEARRADYETLAASFLAMIDMDMNHVNPHLDVASQYTKDEDHVLMTAIDRHVQLAFHNVDWYAAEAMYEIGEYIGIFYNRQRRQARLGYLSPAAYTQQFTRQQHAA